MTRDIIIIMTIKIIIIIIIVYGNLAKPEIHKTVQVYFITSFLPFLTRHER